MLIEWIGEMSIYFVYTTFFVRFYLLCVVYLWLVPCDISMLKSKCLAFHFFLHLLTNPAYMISIECVIFLCCAYRPRFFATIKGQNGIEERNSQVRRSKLYIVFRVTLSLWDNEPQYVNYTQWFPWLVIKIISFCVGVNTFHS